MRLLGLLLVGMASLNASALARPEAALSDFTRLPAGIEQWVKDAAKPWVPPPLESSEAELAEREAKRKAAIDALLRFRERQARERANDAFDHPMVMRPDPCMDWQMEIWVDDARFTMRSQGRDNALVDALRAEREACRRGGGVAATATPPGE